MKTPCHTHFKKKYSYTWLISTLILQHLWNKSFFLKNLTPFQQQLINEIYENILEKMEIEKNWIETAVKDFQRATGMLKVDGMVYTFCILCTDGGVCECFKVLLDQRRGKEW